MSHLGGCTSSCGLLKVGKKPTTLKLASLGGWWAGAADAGNKKKKSLRRTIIRPSMPWRVFPLWDNISRSLPLTLILSWVSPESTAWSAKDKRYVPAFACNLFSFFLRGLYPVSKRADNVEAVLRA